MNAPAPTRTEQLTAVLPDYRRWLYRTALDLLPYGSPHVDDLAQEGLIAMWRAIGTWDQDKGTLAPWLAGAARLRMRNLAHGRGQWVGRPETRGSRSAEATVSIEQQEQVSEDWLDEQLGGVDRIDDLVFAYHRGEIAAAIDRLSPAQRRFILARFYAGMDPLAASPEMRRLNALVPELKRASGLWNGTHNQKGARERLAADLEHLRPLVAA